MPLRNPLEKDGLTEMSAIGAKLISAQSPLRVRLGHRSLAAGYLFYPQQRT